MAIVPGTAGNDFIHLISDGRVPPPGANNITGATGQADSITGGEGNDTVYAGNGADTIIGGAGIDLLFGETGNDRFEVGPTTLGDSIDGGAGLDTLYVNNTSVAAPAHFTGAGGINSIETIIFGPNTTGTQQVVVKYLDATTKLPSNLALKASANPDEFVMTVVGGGTKNMPTGFVLTDWQQASIQAQGDRLVLIVVDANATQLNGSTVADSLIGNAAGDTLNGAAGSDFLAGGLGADRYNGGEGDDIIAIGPGGEDYSLEVYDGGNGFDVMSFGGQGGIVEFNGTVASIESIGFNALTSVTFRADNDVIENFGDGAGVITLLSRPGVRQTLHVTMDAPGTTNLQSVNFINWNPADPSGNHNAGTLDFVVVSGSIGNDTIVGTIQRDRIFGNGGNDTIYGNSGADWLNGGAGNDTYYIDVVADQTIEDTAGAAGGIDTVVSAVARTLGANIENLEFNLGLNQTDNLKGIGNTLDNAITGNLGDNILQGLTGNDTLNGGEGNDELLGDAGNDSMSGGLGNDIYYVDAAGDKTIEAVAQGTDTVYSALTLTLADNVEILRLLTAQNLNGTGNDLANKVFGNNGKNLLLGLGNNDELIGGNDADTLVGGLGNDTLTGGAHNDVFRFESANAGTDVITDFTTGDRFQLSAGNTFSAMQEKNGNTILTHLGGVIRVDGVIGKTIEQWKALISPSPAAAGDGPIDFGDSFGEGHGIALLARLQNEIIQLGHGDYIFA